MRIKTDQLGELIAVERPHAAMLDRSEARRLCWHCFRALLAPVPCPGCSGVLFCGPRCRDEATEAYHAFECGITELFFQANVGCWPLAYRKGGPTGFYTRAFFYV